MEQFGRYRPIAHLGRGGMADVYLAVIDGPSGSGFTKLAVVKHLREGAGEDPDLAAMFEDEARILAHLRHPNIVQVIEVGVHGDEPFLAMEYLDGLTMRRLRQRARKAQLSLPVEIESVALIDVLSALEHAYELETWNGKRLEVIHRDVTPHNVIVTVDGQVKVLDFGIAKTTLREQATAHGIIKGKLRYMSPEQACGGKVGPTSDVFSVGVMLWEAATGARFWHDVEDLDLVRRLAKGDVDRSPRRRFSHVPECVDAICQRALAHRPEDRYPTAAAMRDDLERFLGEDVPAARRDLAILVKRLAEPDRVKLRHIIEEAVRGPCVGAPPRTGSPTTEDRTPRALALPTTGEAPGLPALRGMLRPTTLRWYLAASLGLAATGMVLVLTSTREGPPRVGVAATAETPREPLILASAPAADSAVPRAAPPPAPPFPSVGSSFRQTPRPRKPRGLSLDTTDPWRGAR